MGINEDSPLTDEALCAMVAQGISEAEEELVLRYSRLVRICARPWFLAGGDSEDLIQEGMLGLLKAIRSFHQDSQASFHTFAEICIRNRLRSAIRAARGGKHTPLNDSISFDAPFLQEMDLFNESLEETMIHQEETSERLHQLQCQLSPLERMVLSHYLQGLSCREIAAMVHRSPKSIDNAIQRIRKKLTQQSKGVSSES